MSLAQIAELCSIEKRLSGQRLDFSETFIKVGQLQNLLDTNGALASGRTVAVLSDLLASDRHQSQTQAFHLFGSIAAALATIGCRGKDTAVGRRALGVLLPAATRSRGEKQRASAETVGTLPLNIQGPRLPAADARIPVPRLSIRNILDRLAVTPAGEGYYAGRSLVIPLVDGDAVAVVKMTRPGDTADGLQREARWLAYLNTAPQTFSGHFRIPRPLQMKTGFLFRPKGLPRTDGRSRGVDPATATAIAFTIHRDYFVYPNDHRPERRWENDRFQRVLRRAAGLFGELAAAGIVHTAPVPLFHNRVQRDRRDDGGRYEWDRAGRLDRWLHSSRYPNFGPTGLRDFEHLDALGAHTGRRLYRHIGDHLLSLILVAGSYFRNRDPDRVGRDEQGNPLDVRHLFDRDGFITLVRGVFEAYYAGFTGGTVAPPDFSADIAALVDALVDAMGVDRHMGEILRREDQKRMSAEAFQAVLERYRLTAGKTARVEKGRVDIELQTGPHLGAFNGPISVPELITFLRSASAAIVAGRFMALRYPAGKEASGG